MKTFKWHVLVLSCFLFHQGFAGGVSDGGGGTSNPSKVTVNDIVWRMKDLGKFALAWSYKAQENFLLYEKNDPTNPTQKIFGKQKTIIDVIKTTPFEVRLNSSCKDNDGNDREASVNGSRPGTLCLSAYLLAQKLNSSNYVAEVAALMIHEWSHVLGTTEDEADKIQNEALFNFERLDYVQEIVNMGLLSGEGHIGSLGGWINEKLIMLSIINKSPVVGVHQYEIDRIADDLINLYTQYFSHFPQTLSYAPYNLTNLQRYYFKKLRYIGDYYCTKDKKEEDEVKKYCQENLDKIFQNDSLITIKTAISREDGHEYYDEEADQVTIHKLDSPEVVKQEIQSILDYYQALINSIAETYKFELHYVTSKI